MRHQDLQALKANLAKIEHNRDHEWVKGAMALVVEVEHYRAAIVRHNKESYNPGERFTDEDEALYFSLDRPPYPAPEPHKRVWVGTGYLEQTGYLDTPKDAT